MRLIKISLIQIDNLTPIYARSARKLNNNYYYCTDPESFLVSGTFLDYGAAVGAAVLYCGEVLYCGGLGVYESLGAVSAEGSLDELAVADVY